MTKRKMRLINRFSFALFLLSSLSLLAIPFLNITDKLPATAYIVASVFWAGILSGIGIQIYLARKCKRKLSNKLLKMRDVFYYISAGTLLLLFILSIAGINSLFVVSLCLSIALISVESASIFKREMCLK